MIEPREARPSDPGLALLVAIDGWRGALALHAVREVVRAVAVTPLSGGDGPLLGVINVRGEIVPVADARAALHLPRRETRLTDRFVLVSCAAGTIVVPVDDAVDVAPIASLAGGDGAAAPDIDQVRGLRPTRVPGRDADVVVLLDPDALFGRLVAAWHGEPVAGM